MRRQGKSSHKWKKTSFFKNGAAEVGFDSGKTKLEKRRTARGGVHNKVSPWGSKKAKKGLHNALPNGDGWPTLGFVEKKGSRDKRAKGGKRNGVTSILREKGVRRPQLKR